MPRPKGSKNKWRPEILLSNKKSLQQKAVDMALAGNETCLRICMDRLYPKLRNVAAPVRVKADASDLASQGAAIVAAALSGQLTPDVLRDLLAALADQARLVEFTEIEQRLIALEGRRDAAPWESKKATSQKFPIRGKRKRTKK